MSKAHRKIIVVSAVSWAVALGLMFTQLAPLSDPWANFWRAASVNVGALAGCLTAVAVMPYLLREFYKTNVVDYVGAFLAGYTQAAEEEPQEPAKLRVVS